MKCRRPKNVGMTIEKRSSLPLRIDNECYRTPIGNSNGGDSYITPEWLLLSRTKRTRLPSMFLFTIWLLTTLYQLLYLYTWIEQKLILQCLGLVSSRLNRGVGRY